MNISIVIPAHNEQDYIAKCLSSIDEQLMPHDISVEVIVVLNRCTDKTVQIAKAYGAIVVEEDAKNLSTIKNTGVHYASAEWVVVIDADSWMSTGVLAEICHHAQSPQCVGGGIRIKPERWSLGIAIGYAMLLFHRSP